MDYKKILLVINPAAGITKHRYNIFDIIKSFCENHCLTTTLTTLKAGDAVTYVERFAKEHDIVVCSGGDGTLNETVSALIRTNTNIPVGFIPSGSTNDMAKTLGIPKKPKKAAELITKGNPLGFDVGKFGDDKFFCYTASFGAFTRISYSTSRRLKNIFGHFAYILGGISNAGVELTPIDVHVKADDFETEGKFILGGMFNARSVAGLIRLDNYDVKLDDGLFELILIRNPNNADDLYKIIKNLNKQRFDNDTIIVKRVKSAEFTFSKPTGWSLDGESGGEVTNVTVSNMNNAISIFRRK